MKNRFNILMYSHDTYGLGHIRRTLAIACHLNSPGTNILILTGSPLTGQFSLPLRVDYIRIPGMIKKTNEIYLPLAIRIEPEQVIRIRKSLILATVMTFKPDLFIVDKEPLGLKKEVVPALEWIHRHLPQTRTVLGLRDVMDEARVVKHQWEKKKIFQAMDHLYAEIWIYGEKSLYNPVQEYEIPVKIQKKLHFTGYIPRNKPDKKVVDQVRKAHIQGGKALVLVTIGGGKDGFSLVDTSLQLLEMNRSEGGELPFEMVVVSGPFLPEPEQAALEKRALALGGRIYCFYPQMNALIAASDLLVCMGGYNTLCECLSHNTPALVIPRENPRKEQLIRARAMQKRGMVDLLSWKELTPALLKEKITDMLTRTNEFKQAMTDFPLTGIDRIRERVNFFKEKKQ